MMHMQQMDGSRDGSSVRGWLGFAAVALAATGTWLVVLPWIGSQPDVAARIQEEQQRGIDPSAMFYSDLELLPPIAHRLERMQDRDAAGFWP